MFWRDENGYAHTADAIVFAGEGEELKVLLIRRKNTPYQGQFAFPGGFIDQHEDPFVAALRELSEETGLQLSADDSITSLSVREIKGRDPRGLTKTFPFVFHLASARKVKGADDALTAEWVLLTAIKCLAFDHGAILCEALGCFWQGLPSFKYVLQLPFIFGPKQTHDPLLFYGGSFNPWHDGHLECVSQASVYDGRAVIIVPDRNPMKYLQEADCFWKKYRYLVDLFKDRADAVFPGFFGREKVNPTAHWISKVEAASFIIGDDNLSCLPHWIDYKLFLQSIIKLYVVPRLLPLEHSVHIISQLQHEFPQCKFILLNKHPYQNLSSTCLRET